MTSSVANAHTFATTHTICIVAPPKAVYDLIADATCWPHLFSPTVHVERLDGRPVHGGGAEERLLLWAVANGAVRNWTSRRTLDPSGLRVRFRQEITSPPVAVMAGEWVLIPLTGNATWVVLLHEFRAVDDDPEHTELIKQAVDRNSTAELAALKTAAELGDELPRLVYSFADSVLIDAPPEPVYDFLHRAQDWPQQLPHVRRVVIDEAVPNVQNLEMDTCLADGSVHTTRSVRVCFPYDSIVYKQTKPPEIMSAHVGRWQLYRTATGVRVTSQHTVMIRPDKINGSIERTREQVRQVLGNNSLTTMMHAKRAAESSRVA